MHIRKYVTICRLFLNNLQSLATSNIPYLKIDFTVKHGKTNTQTLLSHCAPLLLLNQYGKKTLVCLYFLQENKTMPDFNNVQKLFFQDVISNFLLQCRYSIF